MAATYTNRINADRHPLSGIPTHDLSVRASEDCLCLRPRGHCDRQIPQWWAAPKLKRLVAGFPPQRTSFKPGSVHVGFCDGQKWRWGRFSPSTWFPLPIFIPPISPQSPSLIIRGWYNRPVVAAVPKVQPHKCKKKKKKKNPHWWRIFVLFLKKLLCFYNK
jgi:hypothetical protein